MNYFDLFDIPVQLRVDASSLKQKFFALSRQFHPDYFAGAGEAEKSEALDKSAILNKAWKTFQQPDATIKYVLEEKGLLEEEEKYELPPAFLLEVLEVNEALMDAGEKAWPGLSKKIKELEKEIYEPVKKIIEDYREAVTTEKELLQVKEYYYKKKYLDRIRRQLGEMR